MIRYFLPGLTFLFFACKTPGTTTSKDGTDNDNNVIIVKSKNTTHNSTGTADTKIEGKNNLIEVNYDSSFYASKNDSSLTIIKGSGNHFIINQHKVISIAENRKDTNIIVAEKQLFKITASEVIDTSSRNPSKIYSGKISSDNDLKTARITKSVTEDKKLLELELRKLDEDSINFLTANETIYVEEIDTNISVREAFSFYLTEIKNGNAKGFYKIGLFYQLGIGTKVNSLKTEEYFEIAARKGVPEAQYSLGFMYEFGFWKIIANKEKAIYYYKMAADQGHVDAKTRLKEIVK